MQKMLQLSDSDSHRFNDSSSSLRSCFSVNGQDKQRKIDRRSVTFNPILLVHETLHVKNFTEEEHTAYWLTKEEYAMIDAMVEVTLQLIELGAEEDDTNHICFRGLVCRTKQERDRYAKTWSDMVISVLKEQERQKLQGLRDPGCIALVSVEKTIQSRLAALLQGQADAIII